MLVEKETGKIEERPKRKKKKEVIVVIVRLSISLRIPKIPKQKEGAQNSKGIDKIHGHKSHPSTLFKSLQDTRVRIV